MQSLMDLRPVSSPDMMAFFMKLEREVVREGLAIAESRSARFPAWRPRGSRTETCSWSRLGCLPGACDDDKRSRDLRGWKKGRRVEKKDRERAKEWMEEGLHWLP